MWPSDVPIYPNAKLMEKVFKNGSHHRIYEIIADPDLVINFYKSVVPKKGWREKSIAKLGNDGWLMIWKKGNRTLQITLEPIEEMKSKLTVFVLQ